MENAKARQLRAEADPLEVGTQLTWFGPNLKNDIIPPQDYPHHRSPSLNPLRTFHSRLLDPKEGVSSRPWTLTLVEGIQTGIWKYAQVWRAVASSDEAPSRQIPLVVKIRQSSFFPIPDDDSEKNGRSWTGEEVRVSNEAEVYRRARDLQGSDLPLCYGYYDLQLPSREIAGALVLEDLVDRQAGSVLDKVITREAKGGRLNVQILDAINCSALLLQKRLHDLGIADVLTRFEHFVLLNTPGRFEIPQLVGVGFSRSSTQEAILARIEERLRKDPETGGRLHEGWDWKTADHCHLFKASYWALCGANAGYDSVAREWERLEKGRNKLDFLLIPGLREDD